MITINEYDYGGAYDIDPEMYFTKEELMDFWYDIVDKLSEKYTDLSFDIDEIYIDDDNELYIRAIVNDDYNISSYAYIDMRRIRKPADIYKYETNFIDEFVEQIDDYLEVYGEGIDTLNEDEICEEEYKNLNSENNENVNEILTNENSTYKNNKSVLAIKEENDTPETDDTEEDDATLLEMLKLGDPWPEWTDAYKVFAFIQKKNKGNINATNQQVKDFYNMFKGVPTVDKAYQRWCDHD